MQDRLYIMYYTITFYFHDQIYVQATFLVHFLTVLINSCITRSTLFKQGPFSLTICFLTMASNAISGVNKPVLWT